MQRDFRLPAEDESYLDAINLPWETLLDGGTRWLVVHERPVPPGYSVRYVSAALMVQPGYPDAELDMVYFNPSVLRADGVPIRALATHSIRGTMWQRWSRHRTRQNPWRPGVDCIATHLALVDHWLARELAKGAAA